MENEFEDQTAYFTNKFFWGNDDHHVAQLNAIHAISKKEAERQLAHKLPATYSVRGLTKKESQLVQSVFGDALPLHSIFISNLLDEQDNPFLSRNPSSNFIINVGEELFREGLAYREVNQQVFIHQLVHVWQFLFWLDDSDIEDRIHKQCACPEAMPSAPAQHWNEYSLEQQALIVEEWFNDGQRPNNPSFSYISNHIRKRRN